MGGSRGRENNKDQMACLFLHLPQASLSSLTFSCTSHTLISWTATCPCLLVPSVGFIFLFTNFFSYLKTIIISEWMKL